MSQKKLTLTDAQKILANPKDVAPLTKAHATRMVQAHERSKQDPKMVAREDFSGKINQVANSLCNGGRNTLLSMVARFQSQTVNHRATEEHPDGYTEEISARLSQEEMAKGLDYVQSCLDEVRRALEGAQEAESGGFKL